MGRLLQVLLLYYWAAYVAQFGGLVLQLMELRRCPELRALMDYVAPE